MMPNSEISAILQKYPASSQDALIPILQDVQDQQGYLSRESMIDISKYLSMPASQVYGVATFYNQFRFEPHGRHVIQVCRGTACHVKGSEQVLEEIVRRLDVNPGQTTKDGQFSLGVVACVGACGLAPVINIDGEYHAEVTPEKAQAVIADILKQE